MIKEKSTSKKAFTLAETLITLGIIGVVAALTIPNLITKYKAKRLRSQFLKSYSVVQQVFKQMEADDVSLNPQDYRDNTNPFYKTFIKYLTGATECGWSGGGEQSCRLYLTGINYHNLTGDAVISGWYFDDGQISLSDGSIMYFENASRTNYIWVFVDLNGMKNPPNRLGYDLFAFEFLDGVLRTMGDKETKYPDTETYCDFSGKSSMNGMACAHLAKTDTSYFERVIKKFK